MGKAARMNKAVKVQDRPTVTCDDIFQHISIFMVSDVNTRTLIQSCLDILELEILLDGAFDTANDHMKVLSAVKSAKVKLNKQMKQFAPTSRDEAGVNLYKQVRGLHLELFYLKAFSR